MLLKSHTSIHTLCVLHSPNQSITMETKMLSLLFVILLTLDPIYSQQCSRQIFDRKDNYIIDIKASVVRGAELVNGMLEETVDDCIQKCCEDSKCDLTLYRKDGISKYGHNCYLVKCGIASNCVEARHNEFMLVPLEPYHDGKK